MKTMKKIALLAAAALAFAACGGKTEENPVLTVEGGRVQGVATGTPGVIVYKGIPYAAPPTGDLRWKEPQPVQPWEGVLAADTFGHPAVQSPHTPGGYTPEFFFDGDPEFSEDCLYLNVWTPAAGRPEAKLPVTLWIHGGGYTAGWGFEPEMDGEEWAKHGGVLVTFNYRLGIFGFLTHPALSAESPHGVSGNYGMLDQIAALKWVKANIAQFGGDPDRITLMGQSAGAMSVQTLVTSPLSKDLVAGAIIQSGGGISARSLLGGTLAGSSPVIDGYALTEGFSEAALAGRIADVPYLIGCTLDDMGGLGGGIDEFCAAREQTGHVAWSYLFARRLPTDGRENVLEGAFHSSELWYMFKSLRFCWRPFIEGDYDLAEQMITYWTNFAKYGDPNGAAPGTGSAGIVWTPNTAEDPSSMIFQLDAEGKVASAMGKQ